MNIFASVEIIFKLNFFKYIDCFKTSNYCLIISKQFSLELFICKSRKRFKKYNSLYFLKINDDTATISACLNSLNY